MEFEKGEENFFQTASQSDSENSSDDSDEDPTYSTIEETQTKFSNLSIKKKTKARTCDDIDLPNEEDSNGSDIDPSELDQKDAKSLEEIQRKIGAGQLEKLKVDQCKVYLRNNGLRLTGNKSTLLQRIKEHLEILNGEGDKKYPVSSFVLNCKGDACTGDVVLFEQNVYDMFNVASRRATGPPCGTRMVAGRIVKESYGAAKQQHTFTIEVLWSKGEKPLPPLHPLLIKGRNLYRLKTLRQKWENEEKRQKILMEKHSRGSLARSDREARIHEKKNRKMRNGNRISKKGAGRNQPPQLNSTLIPKATIQRQNFVSSVSLENKEKVLIKWPTDSGKPAAATKAQETSLTANFIKLAIQPLVSIAGCDKGTTPSLLVKNKRQDQLIHINSSRNQPQLNSTLVPKPAIQQQKFVSSTNSENSKEYLRLSTDSGKPAAATKVQDTSSTNCRKLSTNPSLFLKNRRQDKHVSISHHASQNLVGNINSSNQERTYYDIHDVRHVSDRHHVHSEGSNSYLDYCRPPTYACSNMNQTKELLNRGNHRQPLTSMENHLIMSPSRGQNRTDNHCSMSSSRRQNESDNHLPMSPSRLQNGMEKYHPMRPSRRQNGMQQKLCRYYAQGRCYYGDTCTFSHDMREDFGQRREERWPCDRREFQEWSHDPREFERWA
ncbi:zinc finger CCCH domain-containing protein 62-like [Humulus lupulus]|uniref:zinc finger CCCH domain-containing protein 62-like n=1 Tax=Humulus lupulus TaxID=3486 RepID=UPI002B410DF2|nr:zinc finger CCCH domain-containing protein 62-like [Humulus lupulus]